ncbi:MAG: hypothetical protein ACTS4U_01175 [Candidatus Hodgkinia cicadicola]
MANLKVRKVSLTDFSFPTTCGNWRKWHFPCDVERRSGLNGRRATSQVYVRCCGIVSILVDLRFC